MEKRGQVTTFMIVGFILVVFVISFFIVRQYVLKSDLQRLTEKSLTVPEKIKPIKQKFDTCLESITIDALKLAGSQSGYVQVPINNVPINPSIP
ncbi:MAG: hypothetical protein PHF86_09060, partial [Candidatus Nanoarchaeia archaeon]|nr:hypothetical protein [Candidatus Nanoarchaeia archaeon]